MCFFITRSSPPYTYTCSPFLGPFFASLRSPFPFLSHSACARVPPLYFYTMGGGFLTLHHLCLPLQTAFFDPTLERQAASGSDCKEYKKDATANTPNVETIGIWQSARAPQRKRREREQMRTETKRRKGRERGKGDQDGYDRVLYRSQLLFYFRLVSPSFLRLFTPPFFVCMGYTSGYCERPFFSLPSSFILRTGG